MKAAYLIGVIELLEDCGRPASIPEVLLSRCRESRRWAQRESQFDTKTFFFLAGYTSSALILFARLLKFVFKAGSLPLLARVQERSSRSGQPWPDHDQIDLYGTGPIAWRSEGDLLRIFAQRQNSPAHKNHSCVATIVGDKEKGLMRMSLL